MLKVKKAVVKLPFYSNYFVRNIAKEIYHFAFFLLGNFLKYRFLAFLIFGIFYMQALKIFKTSIKCTKNVIKPQLSAISQQLCCSSPLLFVSYKY